MKYIQNIHNAPITCNARDGKGAILFTKKFLPEHIDGTTGRVMSTGYTPLTGEEYDKLCEGSRTFTHYKDDLKLLVASDDVPPSAKLPGEALADARREAREAKTKVLEAESEIEKLKARVLEAEDEYKRLVSASLDEEKVKGFEDRITSLTAALGTLRGLSKAFAAEVGSAKKLDDAVKAANDFIAELGKFNAIQDKAKAKAAA